MDSLRVDSGIKNIEVNDNGDYISIPISDTSFYERYGWQFLCMVRGDGGQEPSRMYVRRREP